MTKDWTRRLERSPHASSEGPTPNRAGWPSVDVVIGIDYGTRFTKVAVGIGRERMVWQDESGKRLLPSVVYVTPDSRVVSYPDRPPSNSEKVEYLKMLLADDADDIFRSVRSRVAGRPIRDVVRPLAAAFLTGIVRQVRVTLVRRRPDLTGRPSSWFLNVGVPVQYCDSIVEAFKQVAAIAFEWAQYKPRTVSLDELTVAYEDAARSVDFDSSPASVAPELTAALHEFVRDPNRSDDFYGFFDIGGGTLDGAIFRINRSGVGLPLRIHAARVECAGSMAVSRTMLAEMYSKLPHYIEGPLLGTDQRPTIIIPLAEPLAFKTNRSAQEQIQNLVATLIGKARRQFNGQMFSPRLDATARDTRPLRAFLAGGGASSGWYKSAIEETYSVRNLQQWGLTGIRAEVVSRPQNYSGNDFSRFVIALGLADTNAALADAQLPSQIHDADPLPHRSAPPPITKDMV
jgi:hypothetical protein